MIENFFRSLECEGVAYLLISGQATVLYGAAMFSEDIDLWVRPTPANVQALRAALHSQRATYYKLTPPLELAHLQRGHGFHFRLPDDPEWYLDVMGQPPRVPGFAEAQAQATVMATPWGNLPTIGIKHLAALKTTQRLGDYPIISQLVLRYLQTCPAPTPADYEWALANLHTSEDLDEALRLYPDLAVVCTSAPWHQLAAELLGNGTLRDDTRAAVERALSDRILALRQADRAYWRDIIAELRRLRQQGQLLPVGQPTPRRAG